MQLLRCESLSVVNSNQSNHCAMYGSTLINYDLSSLIGYFGQQRSLIGSRYTVEVISLQLTTISVCLYRESTNSSPSVSNTAQPAVYLNIRLCYTDQGLAGIYRLSPKCLDPPLAAAF